MEIFFMSTIKCLSRITMKFVKIKNNNKYKPGFVCY